MELTPEVEGGIRKEAKLQERRRIKERKTVVTGDPGEDGWEYISLRVAGLASYAATVKIAQDRGENLTKVEAEARAESWERKYSAQIKSHQRDRYMSDADFEAWARMKVEQVAANPGPHAQSALRAIMYLKKMREETRARNPEALRIQLMESAEQLARLDMVEAEGRRRGIIKD